MNMELEFYDGSWNTGHYLSHDALTQAGEDQDISALTSGQWNGNYESGPYTPGIVQPAPGNYDDYTQWVYHDERYIDAGAGPWAGGARDHVHGAIRPTDMKSRFRAPFKGFLKNASGQPKHSIGQNNRYLVLAGGQRRDWRPGPDTWGERHGQIRSSDTTWLAQCPNHPHWRWLLVE